MAQSERASIDCVWRVEKGPQSAIQEDIFPCSKWLLHLGKGYAWFAKILSSIFYPV
jgi:hypothetical protein